MAHLNSLDFLAFLTLSIVLLRLLRIGRVTALCGLSVFFLVVASNEYVAAGLLLLTAGCFWIGTVLQRISSRGLALAILIPTLIAVWCFVILSSRYDWLQVLGAKLVSEFPLGQRVPIQPAIVAWSSRVGVSFIALRLSSFLIDGMTSRPRLSFAAYLSYVLYFPSLLAGPIDRPWSFLDKLNDWQNPKGKDYVAGIDRFLSGLCKKFVVADLLQPYTIAALPVDAVPTWHLLAAWIAYSAYIYWEFSGYTDMVIGVSRCLGIELPENFDKPYMKQDMAQFWNSWHISFSSWLRDYIFAPLNLFVSRKLESPQIWTPVPALITTMLLCGLWHGYTLGLLIWGLHHGIGLSCHRVYQEAMRRRLGRAAYCELSQRRAYRLFSWLGTIAYVTIGWAWFALPIESAVNCMARLVGLGA